MAVGDVWYHKVVVGPDGSFDPTVVLELGPGNYLAIAKASFQQRADKADLPEDSFGSLTLDFDDGESIETLDECTAWFGRVNIFDIITPPHHDVIGGMTGGVAVIDALVRVKKGKRGGKLTLLIGAGNTNLSEAKVSVVEVGIPHLF